MSDASKPASLSSARRTLAISALMGIASACLLGVYLKRYEREMSGGERIAILRAVTPVERGVLLTDDVLVEASVPASYVEARAVRASERAKVIGIRTANPLDTQDALMWSDLAIAQEERDLSSLIQPGNRAVTIHASAGSDSGTELIRPGDYVDVIATLTQQDQASPERAQLASIVLLQRILVLAVGAETEIEAFRASEAGDKRAPIETQLLTLSLKVEEAQLLALARERGSLSVIVRNVGDTRIVEAAPDMPVSSLFDPKFRDDLQRRRTSARPVKIVHSAGL